MVKQYKVDAVDSLVEKIQEKKNFILTNYSGIKVKDLAVLRRQLREKNAEYKVIKNNLFKRALNKCGVSDFDDFLKGPIAVAFVADEIGDVAKVLKDFNKAQDKFSLGEGYFENVLYSREKVEKIAELPTKDVLLAQLMSQLNGPTSKIAIGMNQIMSSLARGIKAVAESQGN